MTQEHMNRFMQLVAIRLSDGATIERFYTECGSEYVAAFYLISCNATIFNLTSRYVMRVGIDFDKIIALEAHGYEERYRALMRLAANLYFSNKVKGLDITDIQGPLIAYALDAIAIRMIDAQRILTVNT